MHDAKPTSDRFPLLVGLLATALISGTLVIAGLKAGITPGVSPLVILFAWGAFTKRLASGGGTRFLNIAQVAGSAGMAVCAGVIFTAPLIQILHAQKGLPVPKVDVPTLILLSMAGSLLGFGLVGLATKRFLSDPSLPAPEARACTTMIETAVTDPASRPRLGPSLYAGLVASFLAPLMVSLGLASEHVVVASTKRGDREFSFDLPFTPIYLGIGGLLTLATALLVSGGSFVRLLGDWFLAGVAGGTAAAEAWPANSMRWVGGAAMTVAVAWSLVRFFGLETKGGRDDDPKQLLELAPATRRGLVACSVVGGLAIAAWLFWREGANTFSFAILPTLAILALLMVTLGALLSLQIGSSASPVSGTVFVTTLVLCLVALATGHRAIEDVLVLTPLLVAACVAVCTANDSSQDYKTLQLCGVRVQDGFVAQILGLMVGSIVVPIVLFIAHEAYTLGSDKLVAPQGKMFATLFDGLLLQNSLPWTPIAVGALLGALAVGAEILASKRGLQLPSMAFAVGIYLPPYLGVGILIGALARRLAEGRASTQRAESILAAAGLITGAALFELILGTILVGSSVMQERGWIANEFDPGSLKQFSLGLTPLNLAGVAGILVLAGILFANSRRRRAS